MPARHVIESVIVEDIPRSLLTGRRASKVGDEMARAKIERARSMTPEQRLRVALEFSDLCLLLKRACSDLRQADGGPK